MRREQSKSRQRGYRNDGGEWLTVWEVAAHFHVSPKTVRKWLYERKLRYYKVGGAVRINRRDVERFPTPVKSIDEMLGDQ